MDLGASPILQDGLEQMQKAFVYTKKKQAAEASYVLSLRPEQEQSTLNEFGTKGSKYTPR